MMSDMSGDLLATVLRDSVRYARHEQSALQVSAAFPPKKNTLDSFGD